MMGQLHYKNRWPHWGSILAVEVCEPPPQPSGVHDCCQCTVAGGCLPLPSEQVMAEAEEMASVVTIVMVR